MAITTYDPRQTKLLTAGKRVSGFWDGSSILIELQQPEEFTVHKGALGEVSRTKNTDGSAVLKVQLKSTSPINDFLENLLLVNDGVFPLSLSNPSANLSIVEPESFIFSVPNKDLGQVETSREWAFYLPNYRQK